MDRDGRALRSRRGALVLAVVAVVRASEDEPAAAAGMDHGAAGEHGAPALMEGAPDASATPDGEVLEPRIEGGVWVFELEARPVRWEILPGTRVTAYSYNGIVPGPELRVPYGQRVRVLVRNDLPDPTTVH